MMKVLYTILILIAGFGSSKVILGRDYSEAGIQFTQKFEGLRLVGYLCPANVATNGFGHVGRDVYVGQRITRVKADRWFRKDIKRFERYVKRRIPILLKQHQFDALVDHSFNIGSIKSGLYRNLIAGRHYLAASILKKYNKARVRGTLRVIRGLNIRATARSKLYLRGVYE